MFLTKNIEILTLNLQIQIQSNMVIYMKKLAKKATEENISTGLFRNKYARTYIYINGKLDEITLR